MVSNAIGGPLRSMTAFVLTVVPCTISISCSGEMRPDTSNFSKPCFTPSAKSGGVDGTFIAATDV